MVRREMLEKCIEVKKNQTKTINTYFNSKVKCFTTRPRNFDFTFIHASSEVEAVFKMKVVFPLHQTLDIWTQTDYINQKKKYL